MFKPLEDLKVDCSKLFDAIISEKGGLFVDSNTMGFAEKISNFGEVKWSDKEALIQYHSLWCELRFMRQIIFEKQTLRCLENDGDLQSKMGIKGCNLDFLVGENKICEITSIKEINAIPENFFPTVKGVICADLIKSKILGRINEKVNGDEKEGQIGKCLKLYPAKKVNLVLYLPLSCDYESLDRVIKGDLAFVFEPNGQGHWQDTGEITNHNGKQLDTLITNPIEAYYEKIRFIFISINEKIYYVVRNDKYYILMESSSLSQIFI